MSLYMRFFFLVLVIAPIALAEEADDIREKGIAALKDSQTNPGAVVDAARLFVKAAALYGDAGNEEKNVEMNSFLYWCKKKMTMANIEAFTKGGEAAVSTKLAALDKVTPKADEAEQWFGRAEQFAAKNPSEHLLIAIRFYEVADRFKGSEASLRAQDRSLKEQLEDKASVVKGKQTALVRAADQAATGIGKRAVPDADEMKKSEKTIKELLKEDFAKTDAASRAALIAKLLQQAEENKADAPFEYVLLREARDLAVLAGDANFAAQAQSRLSDAFKISFDALLIDLKKLEATAKSAEPAKALATLCANTSDDALAAGDYDNAVRFNSKADDLLPLIKDAALKARLKTAIPRAQAIKRDSPAALAAQKILATKPDDPEANQTAGKFELLFGDQEKAMRLLSKSSEVVLSGLAKHELTPPQDVKEQTQLADGWFERAEKEPSSCLKTQMQGRAAFWYTSALPGLTGIPKLKVEARLKAMPALKVQVAETQKEQPSGPQDAKPVAAETAWVDLFNGKDLSGWTKSGNATWEVKNGVLVGSDGAGMLNSEKSDFANVAVRVEAMINDAGNSGLFVRGYEAQIEANGKDSNKTGSLFAGGSTVLVQVKQTPVPTKTWFTMTFTADGSHLVVEVNGIKMAETNDDRSRTGRISLQSLRQGTVVSFRRIQVKELTQVKELPQKEPVKTDKPSATAPSLWRPVTSIDQWEKGESGSVTKKADGTFVLHGDVSLTAKGAISDNVLIRAKVKKISGQNLCLAFRKSPEGQYIAFFNGGTNFGIGILIPKTPYKTIKRGDSKSAFKDFFIMTAVAFGDNLRIYANDQLVVDMKDNHIPRGDVGCSALHGDSEFGDVLIMDAPPGIKSIDDFVRLANSAPEPAKK